MTETVESPLAEHRRRARSWLPGRRSRLSLRLHLLWIVVVAYIPLLLFAVSAVVLLAQEQRTTFQDGASQRVTALLTAVDTELKRSIAALEALSTSEALMDGDLQRFRPDGARVLTSRPEWLNVYVSPPSGLAAVNVLRDPDIQVPRPLDEASFEAAVHTRKPTIGRLVSLPESHILVFPVRVPVMHGDEVRYVLTALVRPAAIEGLLSYQSLPGDWVGVVLDSSRTIVARTIGPELAGQPASASLRAALDDADAGLIRGATIEGWPVYTPFHRSRFSGWSVALGIPVAAVEAPPRRFLTYLVAFGLLLLGTGLAMAWVLSTRAASSLEDLARRADELGQGGRLLPSTRRAASGISEVEDLRIAFEQAGQLIRARSDERDRVEVSLRRVEEELRSSERRKDQFLAMLGHELRNPLGVIRTAVQILAEGHAGAIRAAEPKVMIERQVAHMAKLLEDLLDVSRIGAGRIQVNRSLCDLGAIVRSTIDDHRESLARAGIELRVDVPGQPLWVMGDPTRLSQALGNLLQNAEKYTDTGGTVTISLAERDGGESALLSVRDTGVGMEPEILDHAFEAFSQADRTIARSRGGLGLGLPLVKGLIELHGGTVRAASEGSGRGTEVTIQLPLEPALAATDDAVRRAEPPAVGRPRRVLVVEDNEMAARSMQLYLTGLGHAVEVAHTGPEGLAAADAFSPEVVLCDLGLPGIDGFEVARAIRRREGAAGIYLIAVSGYGQAADRRRTREAGFDEHLTKPVDLDELRHVLRDLRRGARTDSHGLRLPS